VRAIQTRTSALESLVEEIRGVLARRVGQLGGLGLLVIAGLAAAALATWSVSDPSINHATDGPTRNLLGPPGAVVADLLMQTLGLASTAMLLPLSIWGIRLIGRGEIARERARLAAWIGGTLLASAALAALPTLPSWPLPTGLGGVVGDLAAGAVRSLAGRGAEGWAPALASLGFALASVAALGFASSAGGARPQERREPFLGSPRREAVEWEPRPSRLSALAGGMRRGLARAKAGLADWTRADAPEADDEAAFERREPAFVAARAAAPAAERFDEEDDTAFLFREADEEPPPARTVRPRGEAEPAPARVKPRPPAPMPGAVSTKRYEGPDLALLREPKPRPPGSSESPEVLRENERLLEHVLDDFGVRGEIINAKPGPVVTLYELQPAPGIKSSRVIGLADDIARSMSAVAARVATVPGRNAIGIELPNLKRETVWLRELLSAKDFTDTKARLPLALGKGIGGEPTIADLARMPHLLIAGTTGSGKSVGINTMILSLLYRLTPEQCRLIMVDPKMLELSIYDGIPHLLTPVVTDPKKAVIALKWAVREMEERYKKMSKVGVRNIDGFNERVTQAKAAGESLSRTVQTGFDKATGEALFEREEMPLETLPYIVVIVDEMADLMMVAGKDIEGAIQRLAQMARAAGIHLVMATQRPSVDVITGTIKANFPTRISFQVTSKIDSRTILGEMGAEQLLGQGDMLYMAGGGRTMRVHGPFVSDEEVGGRRPPEAAGHARISRSHHGRRGRGGPGRRRGRGRGVRRQRQRRQRGGPLRAGRGGRGAGQEGLDELRPAPPPDRLQPGREPHRAHGEGGHRRPGQPCRQARDPGGRGRLSPRAVPTTPHPLPRERNPWARGPRCCHSEAAREGPGDPARIPDL